MPQALSAESKNGTFRGRVLSFAFSVRILGALVSFLRETSLPVAVASGKSRPPGFQAREDCRS